MPLRARHDLPGGAARRTAHGVGPRPGDSARPASARRGRADGASRGRPEGGLVTAQPSDRILERLGPLHPKLIAISLGPIERLLAPLANPPDTLPPLIHGAGTTGKGATIAAMRACLPAP